MAFNFKRRMLKGFRLGIRTGAAVERTVKQKAQIKMPYPRRTNG